MASVVLSRLTTTPRRSPWEGTVPSPMMSKTPSGASSPMTVVTLVVPTSKPAMIMGADSPPKNTRKPAP